MTEDRMERRRSRRELRERAQALLRMRKRYVDERETLRHQVQASTGWDQRLLKEELSYCERALKSLKAVAKEFRQDSEGLPFTGFLEMVSG